MTSGIRSPNSKSTQIGIRCSGAKKYSQRYRIEHFCKGVFQPTKSEVGGVEPKVPQPGSRVPSSTSSRPHPHSHRTHDTTDQWREIVWWLGRFEDFVLLLLLLLLLRACPGPRGHGHAVSDHYGLFCHYLLEDMERTWSRYVRVTQ